MSTTPTAIFIGAPEVGDALVSIKNEWNFLPHVPDIPSLWEGLKNRTITNDIHIILILDHFFDPKANDPSLEKLIVDMSPHCFFGVINYNKQYNLQLKERVDYEAYGPGNADAVMYFNIDPESPNPSIDAAIKEFARKSPAIAAVAAITGKEVEGLPTEEDYQVGPETSSLGEQEPDSKYFGQIIAVTSSKGGSGKSTVASTLATYIAHASEASAIRGAEERPLKVIIVDLDIRDGQLGFLTGNSQPTVINLRINGITKNTLDETIIHSKRMKVDLLLAPKRPRHAEDTPPEFYTEVIQALRQRYDYIILDTSVNYLDPLLEKVAYPAADHIVFVTELVITSAYSMTRWIQETTKPAANGGLGVNPNKIGIIVNKALADVHMDSERLEKTACGLPIISILPSNPRLVANAANLQSIELLLRHQEIRSGIKQLARSIVEPRYNLSDNF